MTHQVHPHGDPMAAAEAVLSAGLRKVFASDEARSLTGLASIHQLANGQGLPAWLLWCAGSRGAYQLEMGQAWQASSLGASARLLVRYFPHPEEPAMAEFSEEEQDLRRGPAFDGTGTPVFGALNLTDSDLFVLGQLELSLDEEGRPWHLAWDAPADGEAVAAWELGLPLVDGLVSALCLAQGRGPAGALALRRLSGEGTPSTGCARLWVSLAGEATPPALDEGLAVTARAEAEAEAGGPLNPEWWRIAGRHFHDADQQAACCCHDH